MKTFIELFAGAGMARLGLGPDWTCVLANDIDPKKGASYGANFGRDHLKVCGVAALTLADFPAEPVDLVWMSPPCVGFSEAGDKQGFEEKQSGAFWPAWRLIKGLVAEGRAPRAIIFENVTGLLSSHQCQDIALIREAFERAGYGHATLAIDAKHFVPQSRPRIFIVGAHGDTSEAMQALAKLTLVQLPKRASISSRSSISTPGIAPGSSRRPKWRGILR
jgi:DNA (cytosine-5)-methyltransferase 1